jgi:5-dehydro-2-deoxygluconokinase
LLQQGRKSGMPIHQQEIFTLMNNHTRFAPGRRLDLICLGRVAVDLYAQQIGSPLEDVTSFARYLGGSSGNVAFGTARLGLKSAMLSRVGADQMGDFLLKALASEGCDVSMLRRDPEHLTALAILGIKDRETFPLLFYRQQCADMALVAEDISEEFIASAKALAITGTHLSEPGVHAAATRALQLARKHGVRTVLDIDYRPVLWGLTQKADGETRFIADSGVSAHLQASLAQFDLIVGTEEEFRIAGGCEDLLDTLKAVRAISDAVLVVKRGPLGCTVIDGPIPDSLDGDSHYQGVEVEVLNVLGAGDAFMSGFLKGWLMDRDYATCCDYANTCGAIVVSRHGCAPAMPTPAELDYFLAHADRLRRPDQDEMLARLHRVGGKRAARKEVFGFAFDHRNQFFELAQQVGADETRIGELKQLFVRAVAETEMSGAVAGQPAVLVDDRYGQDALNAATGRGWWIGRPVELPGSNPLEFESAGMAVSMLRDWPAEHIVKCLVQYHPDDEPVHRLQQESQIRTLYQATRASGHELLLEVIPPKDRPQSSDTVYRALKRLYNLGIYPEWWKLEPMSPEAWRDIDALIGERDPHCQGVVLLGLNASADKLAQGFADARASKTCRGFTVGRTIFQAPSRAWLAGEIDDAQLVAQVRANFEGLIREWQASRNIEKAFEREEHVA